MALFLSGPFKDPWIFVWLCHAPCGPLIPSQGWNPGPCSRSVDRNCRTAREGPGSLRFHHVLQLVFSVGLVFSVLGKAPFYHLRMWF